MSRRLNGHVAFDIDQLPAIAEFLQVPVAALLADPSPAVPPQPAVAAVVDVA